MELSSFPEIPDILTKAFALCRFFLTRLEAATMESRSFVAFLRVDFLPTLICHRNCNRYLYF